jgi:hypothetical protein
MGVGGQAAGELESGNYKGIKQLQPKPPVNQWLAMLKGKSVTPMMARRSSLWLSR